jgi:amidohydrolase
MNTEIKALAQQQQEYMVRIRRDIHQNPEPSTKEFRTQQLVIDELKKIGITEIKKYFDTGVAATIRGGKPGRTIGIRADMDALLMDEKSGLPFASKTPGVAHTCGHDGHTAILLGTAHVLNKIKNTLCGNVKLIFQPAEENGPQGGGAQYMIKEGVLTDEPAVDFMIGLHLNNNYSVGQVISRNGVTHAGSDPFYLDIYGVGGHASKPHLIKDPIVAAAYIITALQTVISRNISPFDNAVVGVSMIEGGTRHNIVPEKVHIRGTIRSFNDDTRRIIGDRITAIVNNVAIAMDVRADLDIRWNYGPLKNDPQMFEQVKTWVEDIVGKENFVTQEFPNTGGEDFSYFASTVPSVYFWLGSQEQDGVVKLAHSPNFNFNENCMQHGVIAFTRIVLGFLNNK